MLTRLRMLTAGESHGPALVGILDGLPRGIPMSPDVLRADLKRRRAVAGRSARQQLESDDVDVLGGMRHGTTSGAPVALLLRNAESARWADVLSPWARPSGAAPVARVTVPRPGHADLAGSLKLHTDDLRDVIERASARETAMRTALGAFARSLLASCGVEVTSQVRAIGDVALPAVDASAPVDLASVRASADASDVRCVDPATADRMRAAIESARAAGDTLGGEVEVRAAGMPAGVGSFAQADLRLSARLTEAVGSIHAIKAVGVGAAWDAADVSGRSAHDEIHGAGGARLIRPTNRAGGIEGGVTNGEHVVVRAVMKPLSTVAGGLPSVNLADGTPARGHVERTDTCAVPAAAVVAEAMVCLVLADALLVSFGGDTLDELRARVTERRMR